MSYCHRFPSSTKYRQVLPGPAAQRVGLSGLVDVVVVHTRTLHYWDAAAVTDVVPHRSWGGRSDQLSPSQAGDCVGADVPAGQLQPSWQ